MDLRHWMRAASAFARHSVRTPGFATEALNAGLAADTAPKAPTRHLFEAFPKCEGATVPLGDVTYRRSNLDPYEQFVLGALARTRPPKRIFEIGTYDGATTLLLARCAPQAEILTLDLPSDKADAATEAEEVDNAAQGDVGLRFRGTDEAQRITQLFGDSRTFDFSPWFESCDIVLVDGGHEYDVVKKDTASALGLAAPGGLVVWDDYMVGWPGVVQAVDEAAVATIHIAVTDFAVYEQRQRTA